MCLPSAQREALLLVGASGFSYEAAAEVAGCAVGTMKSRVARGRTQLERILEGEVTAEAEAFRWELLRNREEQGDDRARDASDDVRAAASPPAHPPNP